MMVKKSKIGVSVVIPSFNNRKKLFRLLDSLKKSTHKPIQVIVVDNSSSEEIIKMGKKRYKWVKWIDIGRENLGQTKAYNVGFANSDSSHHILYCDEDVVLERDTIKYLVERLEKGRNIGIVTPMILYLSDRNWVNQAGAEVNLWTGKVTIGWGPRENFMSDREVQGSGTVMLIKRDLVNRIGGFEDWFLCYSDPEYCVRAQKAGFKNWYEPKAICYHDQPKDERLWRPRVLSRAFLLGRNRTLFMRKHGKTIFFYILFIPFLLGYYLLESIKFNIFPKWIELIRGTIAGFFYPLNKDLKIPLTE